MFFRMVKLSHSSSHEYGNKISTTKLWYLSNSPTFVEKQIKFILSLVYLTISFERITPLIAHSLHKPEVLGSSPVHET